MHDCATNFTVSGTTSIQLAAEDRSELRSMENALAHTTFFSSPLHFVSLPKQNPPATAYPIPPDPIPFTPTLQAATEVEGESPTKYLLPPYMALYPR